MLKLELKPGQKIVVFNTKKEELGEGTLIQHTLHADMNLIAYECEEHTILARGTHYVRVSGELFTVNVNSDSGLA